MGLFKEYGNVTNIDSFECLDEKNNPKKEDENVMDMVFILDKSGSMYELVDDTIGGFNSYIDKEKEKDEKIFVTLVLFDTEYSSGLYGEAIANTDSLERLMEKECFITDLYKAAITSS